MKNVLFRALLFSLPLWAAAQNGNTASQISERPQDTPFSISKRGPNDNVWQRTTYEQLPSGKFVPHLEMYQETATGLNFKNPDTGQWEASSDEIEIVPGGAVAKRGQHKVIFAADLATFGAIDVETPDGQRLKSHMLGLCYFDQASGQSVFIAEVTNSIGQLISSNQVWYDNAFTGLKAGVRYTYTREGFEQDVILEEQPPTPESYGLNSSTTVLQAYTEFISPPRPAVSMSFLTEGGGRQLTDKTLSFSTMKIGRGRAFLGANSSESTAVAKDWVTLEGGRQFLIEQIPVTQIINQLQTLPPPQASVRLSNSVLNVVSSKRLIPEMPIAKASVKQIKMASLSLHPSGFVLDYTSLNTSQTNYTFRGDTTYYISGNVDLYGTNTTFEGGTVLKYNNGVSLSVYSPVTWGGSAYRPVVLLSKDDNSIAETLSGISTGNPGNNYYATKALYFDGTSALTNLSIDNLRILNAQVGLVINGRTNHMLNNVQVAKCGVAVAATNADFSLRNALFSSVLTNFSGSSATGHVEQLTSDVAAWLNKDIGANLFLTNCILSAVTNLGNCTTQNVAIVSSAAGVFQTAGAGAYYLANGSSYRDAGTTNISPALLVQLGRKTTYPPILILNSNFNTLTTLGPAILRDTNAPDLGYHYDPMDYVFSGVNINTNMTISAGTAIGWYVTSGFSAATHLADKTIISFNGRLDAPDYFVRTSTAQEGNSGWGSVISGFGIIGSQNQDVEDISYSSEIDMNFTMMAAMIWDIQFRDNYGFLVVRANNSILTGGNCGGYLISHYFTNCLMDNQQIGTVMGYPGNAIYLRNCTLHNGYFYGSRSTDIPISVRDSAFDGVALYNVNDGYSSDSTNTDYHYNAYTNATDPFPNPQGVNNDQQSVSFNWQTGPLGRFYLPTNSVLINAGHTTADQVGLFHFTTQTNQLKETNSVVDIGYHYVALDPTGNPVDSNGDGVPDYLQDANGNGICDGTESCWAIVPVITTQPVSRTNSAGTTATFSVIASGTTPLNYQWKRNGTNLINGGNISGANTATLTLTSVQDPDSSSYTVVVANMIGSVASTPPALLTVIDLPIITTQPANQTVIAEQDATFTAVADGPGLTYQWTHGGVNISGATNTTLVLHSVQTSDGGTYNLVVTDTAGSVTSTAATLTVLLPPVSWLQQYFGSNFQTNANASASADPDGDGVDNLHEYLRGTNPTNYYNGAFPGLTMTGGNNQSGAPNSFLSTQLTVHVTTNGTAAGNAPLAFGVTSGLAELAVNQGDALASTLSLRADGSGNASVWLFLTSDSPVTNLVTVTASTDIGNTQVIFTNFSSTVATPTIVANGGTSAVQQFVTISCATSGAVIHYTLNGNDPTELDPTNANGGSITVFGTCTVKARAFKDDTLFPSGIASAVFNVTGGISAGDYFTLALKFDGSVWAAGTNTSGQLGDGTFNNRSNLVNCFNLTGGYAAIAAGGNHSIALYTNGTLKAWGTNNNGQLGDTTTTSHDSPVNVYHANLTLVTNVSAIAAGGLHSLALLSNGTVRAWGDNSNGQLGDTTTTDRHSDVAVVNLTNATAIAAGDLHSLAISNGMVWAWGNNAHGEIGDNTTSDRSKPTLVANLSGVSAIAAGGSHSLALSNGTVRAWGTNASGQLGDGTNLRRLTNVVVTNLTGVVAIAAGTYHSLALLSDGTVRSWGLNTSGQLGDGTLVSKNTNVVVSGLSNVVAISAGVAHSVALKSDGTLVVWGYTNYGLAGGFSSTPVVMQPTNHLTYAAAPSIVTQPQNQTTNVGATVTFSVTVVGANPMAYQWYISNSSPTAISGATNSALSLSNVQTNTPPNYFVVITNAFGSVTSSIVQLSAVVPLAIVAQPTNQTVIVRGTASFSVSAVGPAPLYYQWSAGSTGLILGATNATLVINNVQTSNADGYSVVVWYDNYQPSVTSTTAVLTVISPLSITVPPTNEIATVGNIASFSVSASGPAPITYQWYFNSSAIANATNAALILTNVQSSNGGPYAVVVSSPGGIATNTATLTVVQPVCLPPPSGLVNWWPAEVNALDIIGGANGTLNGNTISYTSGEVGQAFHFGGAPYCSISFGNTAGNFGTNDFTLEFWIRTTAKDFGEYPILTKTTGCNVSGLSVRMEGQGYGNTKPGTVVASISQSTNLTVQSSRTINDGLFHHLALVRQTTNLSLYIDGNLETMSSTQAVVSVSNSAVLLAGLSPCVGADTNYSSYFVGDMDEISLFSRALSSDEVQWIYNAASSGKCAEAPVILTQPTNQIVNQGANAAFTATATGNLPLSYQWYGFNSGAIAGATNTTLSLNNAQSGNADTYYVVVSNGLGSTGSATATLVVETASDTDGNGLPDSWEIANFGHIGVDPNADPDGDGLSNLQEYLNGTNPNAANQLFRTVITRPSNNSVIP